MITAKPFIKWVGGKTQLLDEIRRYYPTQIEKYCEPFVGGSAVLFDVLSRLNPKEVLINDINGELINTYCQIKTNCNDLTDILAELQERYWKSSIKENKSLYFEKRERFNSLKLNGKKRKSRESRSFHFLKQNLFQWTFPCKLKRFV